MVKQMSERILLAYDDMARLEAEINTGTLMLHLTVSDNQWSKAKYKEWKNDWEQVKALLKAKGYNELYTLIPIHDMKIQKFQRMFGFKPLLTFSDAILFKQEI